MIRRARRAVLLLVALFVASAALAGSSRGRLAAWVVRDRITSPEAVEEVCREARDAGIDTLVVQVRGRGDAYYQTALAPRAEALSSAPPEFDPLAEVLRRAKGMRVVAWLNVFFVWSGETFPSEDSHVFWSPEDWILEDRDGREVWTYSAQERALGWLEGIYVDPESRQYRAHFADLAAEVAAKYRVDGIHLDFVRYPGAGYGKGGPLGEAFRKAWGFDPRWIPEALDTPSPTTLLGASGAPSARVLTTASFLWKDFRASQVTELVRTVRKKLRAGPRPVELSAAVFPGLGGAYLGNGQDWTTWASEGLVDALFPMVYFGGADRVGTQLREIAEVLRSRGPKVRLWAGLGGYIKEPGQIAEEARTAWSLGYRGVCLFDLGSLAKKPGGVKPYAEAVRGARKTLRVKVRRVPKPPGSRGDVIPLARALDRASGCRVVWGKEERRAASARWAEFQAARRGVIPGVVEALERATFPFPEWVELRGVFRYVSPDDGDERRHSQRAAAEAALERLQAGEDLSAVSKEVSQGSSRTWGGVLGRRYLDPSEPANKLLLSLASGQLSPVVETPNGYWVYRVEARGGGEPIPVAEMPWPARRVLFQRALFAEMGVAAPSSLAATPRSSNP